MKFAWAEELQSLFLSPASQRKAWAAFALAGALLWLFGGFLFSTRQLVSIPEGDLANFYFGERDFGFTQLANGHLPLWNPFLYCGAPFFADPHSGLLYPPNWIFLFLPLVSALNLCLVLHIFLAGFFMYLWLAKNHLVFLAALFGAFTYMLGGAFFSHVYPGHLANLCTMAWIPLVFLSVERLLETPNLKNLLSGAGILSFQLLSGHAQYFVYTLYLAGLYALGIILLDPKNLLKKIGYGSAMLFTAFSLTSIQWLTGLVASTESLREPPASLEAGKFFSFHPFNLLTLLASGLNGNSAHFSAFWGGRLWWESCLFIGGVAFLMACYGLDRKENQPEKTKLLVGLALFSILLAFGSYTPVYPLLDQVIPMFKSFRGSFKFDIFFQLAIAFLAALGFQAWFSEARPKNWPVFAALSLSFLFLAGALYVLYGSGLGLFSAYSVWNREPVPPSDSAAFFLQVKAVQIVNLLDPAAMLLVFASVWVLDILGPGRKYTLALLGMAGLLAFAQGNLSSFDARKIREENSAIQKTLASRLGDSRIYWAAHDDRALALRYPDIWGDDPLLPRRFNYFMDYGKAPAGTDKARPDSEEILLTPVKMRLMRLSFLLDSWQGPIHISQTPLSPVPRAFLAGRWEKAEDGKEAMERLSRPDFDPLADVILEKTPNPLPDPSPTAGGSGVGKISFQDRTSDWLEVQVETDKPKIFVMTDNYSRDWKARAYPDSVQSSYEVLPGDWFARAIPLSAGKHHFDLIYDPWAFRAGKWISIISLLGYFLAWGWLAFRKPLSGVRRGASIE